MCYLKKLRPDVGNMFQEENRDFIRPLMGIIGKKWNVSDWILAETDSVFE